MAQTNFCKLHRIAMRTIARVLICSLLISGCASTTKTQSLTDYDQLDRQEVQNDWRRSVSKMLAAVSNSDRESCEQFARSEADAIKDTRVSALLGAIGGSLMFAKGAPFAFVLFGIPTIAVHASEYSNAHAAVYYQAIRECVEPPLIEAELGPQHPNLAGSLTTLARRYTTGKKYLEAEALYRRAIAIQEKALGPEHPELATTLEAYARVLARLDRQPEAEDVVTRYLTIRERHKQDSKGTEENVVRRPISRRHYQAVHQLTDVFLKEMVEKKCPVMAECARHYVEQVRELARAENYPLTPSDEATFRSELEIAMDADEGKTTRDEALNKLQMVTTKHLVDMYFGR